MSKQMVTVALAMVLGVLAAMLLLDRPSTARAAGGEADQFIVVGAGNAFVMVDTANTNNSWVLLPPKETDKKFAWFPVKRLDTDQAVQVWRIGGKPE